MNIFETSWEPTKTALIPKSVEWANVYKQMLITSREGAFKKVMKIVEAFPKCKDEISTYIEWRLYINNNEDLNGIFLTKPEINWMINNLKTVKDYKIGLKYPHFIENTLATSNFRICFIDGNYELSQRFKGICQHITLSSKDLKMIKVSEPNDYDEIVKLFEDARGQDVVDSLGLFS